MYVHMLQSSPVTQIQNEKGHVYVLAISSVVHFVSSNISRKYKNDASATANNRMTSGEE